MLSALVGVDEGIFIVDLMNGAIYTCPSFLLGSPCLPECHSILVSVAREIRSSRDKGKTDVNFIRTSYRENTSLIKGVFLNELYMSSDLL
jgi:hypothetical protein